MAYTEWTFFLYFAVVAAIYFFLPGKARRVWLLLCSLGYVFLWQVSAGFFVVGSSLVTYLGARLVAPQPETENREHRRRILAVFAHDRHPAFGLEFAVRPVVHYFAVGQRGRSRPPFPQHMVGHSTGALYALFRANQLHV